MKIFISSALSYLENNFVNLGKFEVKKFPDGEAHLRITEHDDEAFVMVSTFFSCEAIIELLFMLDALQRLNVKVKLFFTYFAYARQDKVTIPGEVLSLEVIANLLKPFNLENVYILHPHNNKLETDYNFNSVIPIAFFEQFLESFDIFVAPDKGSFYLCEYFYKNYGKPFISLNKVRLSSREVKILDLEHSLDNLNCLILDDMISTGNTILESAKTLKKLGAKSVSVAATHGIFCTPFEKIVESDDLDNVFVTNSTCESYGHRKVKVYNIVDFIDFESFF